MSGSGWGCPFRRAYSQKEQPLRLPTAASSPYILRTVTFLWNVPVFHPAYSALPKRSDFSRFAAYEGGAIETMCFLPPLCTLRTSAPKGGMVPLYASPLYPSHQRAERRDGAKGKVDRRSRDGGVAAWERRIPPSALYRCGRASTRSMALRYSSSVFKCSMIMGISGFTASARAM